MKKVWEYNKYETVGFEGGVVPSARASFIGFIFPTPCYTSYPDVFPYTKMLSLHFWKWYVGIKWNVK